MANCPLSCQELFKHHTGLSAALETMQSTVLQGQGDIPAKNGWEGGLHLIKVPLKKSLTPPQWNKSSHCLLIPALE